MIVKFPSGRITEVVTGKTEPPQIVNGGFKIRRRRSACKHIGKEIHVESICNGVSNASTWECALHGQCAPLAMVELQIPGVTTCSFCDDWVKDPKPGLIKLGLNYYSATSRWHRAGRPIRSQERVNELLQICRTCPFLTADEKRGAYCGKCGCPINGKVDNPTENKLAMATERCPLDPPRWEADV